MYMALHTSSGVGKVVMENNLSFCDSPGAVVSKITCGIPIPSLLTVLTSSLIGNIQLSRGDIIFYISKLPNYRLFKKCYDKSTRREMAINIFF